MDGGDGLSNILEKARTVLGGLSGFGDLDHRLPQLHFETEESDEILLTFLVQTDEIGDHSIEIPVRKRPLPGHMDVACWGAP